MPGVRSSTHDRRTGNTVSKISPGDAHPGLAVGRRPRTDGVHLTAGLHVGRGTPTGFVDSGDYKLPFLEKC